MAAAHFRLGNIVAFIDKNDMTMDGATDDIMRVNPVDAKFAAFGWHVVEVDGHDIAALVDAVDALPRAGRRSPDGRRRPHRQGPRHRVHGEHHEVAQRADRRRHARAVLRRARADAVRGTGVSVVERHDRRIGGRRQRPRGVRRGVGRARPPASRGGRPHRRSDALPSAQGLQGDASGTVHQRRHRRSQPDGRRRRTGARRQDPVRHDVRRLRLDARPRAGAQRHRLPRLAGQDRRHDGRPQRRRRRADSRRDGGPRHDADDAGHDRDRAQRPAPSHAVRRAGLRTARAPSTSGSAAATTRSSTPRTRSSRSARRSGSRRARTRRSSRPA